MKTRYPFNFATVHPSWYACLEKALSTVDTNYLDHLAQNNHWLPGPANIFNSFSIPLDEVNYVLFGESPYPRAHSANGYAFWDESVTDIWSETGLSKPVNRATSLRNIIKMLLIAEGALDAEHVSQSDIAELNKQGFVKTNKELFKNLLQHGFLLLNASLVLQPTHVRKDAKAWQPFVKSVLEYLLTHRPQVCLILFGNIAKVIDKLVDHHFKTLYVEHPYNHSFITNEKVLKFFKPLHLLRHNPALQEICTKASSTML